MTFNISRRRALAAGAALALPTFGIAAAARAQEAPAASRPAYSRRLGDLEISAVSDGYLDIDGAAFLGIEPAAFEEALAAAFLAPGPVRVGVSAHLIRTADGLLLIDAGAADLLGPTAGGLTATLAGLGAAPADIDAVLLTHMHPDHIGGLLAAGAPTFPNATLHVSAADLDFWTDEAIAGQVPAEVRPFFERAIATAAAYGDRVTPFSGDVEVAPGVEARALPGHTPGHTGFLIASGDAAMLVFGDAAHVAAVQFARPGVALAFDSDPAQGVETRRRVLDMAATDRLLVAGAHMPFPSFGHVIRVGDAYAWAPEEWRYD